MESINFKRKGILYNLHNFFYKEDAEDTCTFKSHLIIAFILYVVTIYGSLLRTLAFMLPGYRADRDNYGFAAHLIFVVISLLAIVAGHAIVENGIITDFIWWHKLSYFEGFLWSFVAFFIGMCAVASFGLAIVIAGSIIYYTFQGISWLWNLLPHIDLTDAYGEPNTKVGVLYAGAKEKWCKRINWEE